MPNQNQSDTRQRILKFDDDLFSRCGYRGIGADTIIKKSGVAKMSLYQSYPAKDDLTVACLEEGNSAFWNWVDQALRAHEGTHRQHLLAIFAALEKLLKRNL